MRRDVVLGVGALSVAGAVSAGVVLGLASSSDAAPTKAAYFARVARICAVYGPRLDRVGPPTDVTIPGEVVTPLRRVIPIIRAEMRAVGALRPPHELAALIGRWLVLKSRALASLVSALHAAEEPNIPATATAYLRFLSSAQDAARLGARIGFPAVCASSR